MKSLFAVIFLIIAGPFFLWMGVQSLRRGWWRESVPLLEVAIDRAVGVEPPPRTAWDRRFALGQAIMFTLFGAFFSVCLLAILLDILGVI